MLSHFGRITLTLLWSSSVAFAADTGPPKPIRKGWSGCLYLEVTGPAAQEATLRAQAKKQYREPDEAGLARAATTVVVRIATIKQLRCGGMVPKEVIFADIKRDEPVLRVPLAPAAMELKNVFGATWSATDGVGLVDAEEFRAALSQSYGYKVVVPLDGGAVEEIDAEKGKVPWSVIDTQQVIRKN